MLVGGGRGPGRAEALSGAAARLADRLSLPLHDLTAGATDPDAALAALAEQPGPWLAILAADPGQWQDWGGRWAETLGAWRQPAVLLIEAEEADTGHGAAYTALLERAGVPLLGLVQWGGVFAAGDRNRDGLPWLGGLRSPEAAAAAAVAEEEELELVRNLGCRWIHGAVD